MRSHAHHFHFQTSTEIQIFVLIKVNLWSKFHHPDSIVGFGRKLVTTQMGDIIAGFETPKGVTELEAFEDGFIDQ
jgi:hypothetical protein